MLFTLSRRTHRISGVLVDTVHKLTRRITQNTQKITQQIPHPIAQRLFGHLFHRPAQTYEVVSVKSETTDIRIEHVSGVVLQIEHDGTVILSTPGNMALHADGDLRITSDTHIGLAAPRIDLN